MGEKKNFLTLSILLIITVVFLPALYGMQTDKHLSEHQKNSSGEERLTNLIRLTRQYRENQPQKALKYGKDALKLMQPGNFKRQKKLLKMLSDICKRMGMYQQALHYYKQMDVSPDTPLNVSPDTGQEKIWLLREEAEWHRKEFIIILVLIIIVLIIIMVAMLFFNARITRKLHKSLKGRSKKEIELRTIGKLESIERLAGGLAHDYNNLLSIIAGNLSLAQDGLEDYPQILKIIKSAERSTHHASQLSKTLITFSSGGWISPESIRFEELIHSIKECAPQLGELEIETAIAPDLESIYVDKEQFCQVLYNILQNSLDAGSQKNGSPCVKISAKNIELPWENNFLLKKGPYVEITVTDWGEGIEPQHMDKIYDPYFSTRVDNSPMGNGLGLSVCYAVVKKHKGHLTITSTPNKGTSAMIYIPTAATPNRGAKPPKT